MLIDMLDIAARAVLSVLFLFIITRLMGRKQISQLSFFDYIIGISIGSIAASMAISQDVSYIDGILSMSIYAAIAIAISILTNKSLWFRRFINGRVYMLIKNGKILNQNLSKIKYDVNDLLSEARYAGYFDIADVEYAVMEPSGRISFMPKSGKSGVLLEDIGIVKPQEHLVANIVIDGKIMLDNLKMTGLDETWLLSELKKQHCIIEEIILATVDSNNKLIVYPKSKQAVQKTYMD